jgi:ABC-2 type transport system permease protein
MSTLSYTVRDSRTMLRRNLRHTLRYPAMTGMIIAMPVIFLLLFVYVFGATLGAGLAGGGGRAAYVNFVTPGILLFTVGGAAVGTAVSVATDMASGIVARFRTMAISRASVLTGHVLGSVIKTMLGIGVVIGIALLVGFRPTASPVDWLAAVGLLALFVFAVTWLSVALGLVARTAESASNTPMPLMLLPLLGSGFVPTSSMPEGLRWFAEYQPFTPVIDTLRGLLLGGPVGSHAMPAVAWSVGIALASYLWARKLYDRDPVAR